MAANLTVHIPMGSVETVSGNTPQTGAISEKSGQTFLLGVPVQLTTGGYVQKWDGTTFTAGILGISLQPAANLATDGKGTPGLFGQVGPPAAIQTYGTVPNQPSAVNIAYGAPPTEGRNYFEQANNDTIFEGQFDNSAGSVPADYIPTIADVGKQYGITFDAGGTAYVDKGKATVGTNTCVIITGINPNDLVQAGTANTYIANARVRFKVVPSAQQLIN
jgi:hypothetical protein